MIEFILVAYAIAMIVCIGNLVRVNKFGKFLRAEISRVSEIRLSGNREQMWPDVIACYKNLKWYDIFNYDFKSLLVYDRAK
jgi:hypothetical protein